METVASMSRDDFMSRDVHFAFNSFTLSGGAKALLEQKAQWLSANPEVAAQIEGHCDERGTIAYNLALGERRANAVRQYLVALGVSPSRLTSISYGEEFPLDPGHNEEAWAQNRRAHFAILNQ
jgi:peptidoglycan-associated lipoprotein